MTAQELRPMGIGDILDMTFRLYRQRFVPFLTITLICYVPYAVFMSVLPVVVPVASSTPLQIDANSGLSSVPGSPSQHGNIVGPQINPVYLVSQGLGVGLFVLIILPLCQGAMIQNISASYLGDTLSASDSYARAVPRLIPLLWTNLLLWLAVWVGIILCIVPGIIFSLWFMVAGPIVILEGVSGPRALGRSRELMRGNLDKGLVLVFLVAILGWVFNMGLAAVIKVVPWPHIAVSVFIQCILPAIILPIQAAPLILLYYDLRIRKEAFDLQRLAESLGSATPTTAES